MPRRPAPQSIHAALRHNRTSDYGPGEFPACFDSRADYDDWLLHDGELYETGPLRRRRRLWPFDHIPNFCADCTAQHKRDMQAQGRCEFPSTRFFPATRSSDPASVEGYMVMPGVNVTRKGKVTA